MDSKILKYFKKNHIQIEDIKYLTRVDGKTCIHTMLVCHRTGPCQDMQ